MSVINRGNFVLVNDYIKYLRSLDEIEPESIDNREDHLIHLLYWLGEAPIERLHKMTGRFPEHLTSPIARRDGKDKPLSSEYIRHVVIAAVSFCKYLADNHTRYRKLHTVKCLQKLRLTRTDRKILLSRISWPEFVKLDLIIKISLAPTATLLERRLQAALCWLYLSAQRAHAFVTTPLTAIDLEKGLVHQLPQFRVETKNDRFGITKLLPRDPSLAPVYDVVANWIRLLKDHKQLYFFAPIDPISQILMPQKNVSGKYRDHKLRNDYLDWHKKTGVPYINLHAFRHGYAHYAIKHHCKTMAKFQVMSTSMLHSNIAITSQIYCRFIAEEMDELFSAEVFRASADVAKNSTDLVSANELLGLLKNFPRLPDDKQRLIMKMVADLLEDDARD